MSVKRDKTDEARAFNAAQLAKLNLGTLDAALKARYKNPASVEFQAGNALNTARDVGYTAALQDVYACRPEATGTAQEALDAWQAAIEALTPQFPP